MKLACLVRGPIRPNSESVISNIKTLLASVDDKYPVDCFLCTWEHDVTKAQAVIDRFENMRIIICKLENSPYDKDEMGGSPDCWMFNKMNCYKQYVSSRYFIGEVSNYSDYDFIIHTRTDLRMKVSIEQWLYKDSYVTISSAHSVNGNWNPHRITNDQFAIAQPSVMKDAWDYGSEEQLIRMINTVAYSEMIIDNNIIKNCVRVRTAQPIMWELDKDRHS